MDAALKSGYAEGFGINVLAGKIGVARKVIRKRLVALNIPIRPVGTYPREHRGKGKSGR